MTPSSPAPQNRTALALLFGQQAPEVAIQGIWDTGSARGVAAALDNIGPVLRRAATREVTTATVGLLQLDLIDMLVAGWRKQQDLVAAARRTVNAPGSTELVELARHRVTCTESPYVNLVIDGATAFTVQLKLSVLFDVTVLTASVRMGRIVALHSGRCDVTSTLVIEGIEVATGREHFDLQLVVTLGNGIPLLHDADGRAAGEPGDTRRS
jgi:hypothetical protein